MSMINYTLHVGTTAAVPIPESIYDWGLALETGTDMFSMKNLIQAARLVLMRMPELEYEKRVKQLEVLFAEYRLQGAQVPTVLSWWIRAASNVAYHRSFRSDRIQFWARRTLGYSSWVLPNDERPL